MESEAGFDIQRPNRELEVKLIRCKQLPSPPGVALRIVELANNPETELDAITEVIEMDPALAAKMLRIANSPLYGQARKCDNVRKAVRILGLNSALNLSLSFSLVGSLYSSGKGGIDYSLFWRRSMLAAACARVLGEHLQRKDRDSLLLAALLQDIGMLVFERALPDIYSGLASVQADHAAMSAAEKKSMGMDHASIGAWLLGRWRFPQHIQTAVGASHLEQNLDNPDDAEIFLRCVALSGRLADIWLSENPDHATAQGAKMAERLLRIGQLGLENILHSVKARIPEIESLFDIKLLDHSVSEKILEQARRILLTRSMWDPHEAARL